MATLFGGWGPPTGRLPENPYIILSERIELESDGSYSAFCDDLGIATFAESHPKAQERLRSAILATLTAATQRGEVLELLKLREIRLYSSNVGREGWKPTDQPSIRISPSVGTLNYHGTSHRPYDVMVGAD